jgi:glyoxylase-like metal-dependent hydrolase (beta-lactamase superfamily II)
MRAMRQFLMRAIAWLFLVLIAAAGGAIVYLLTVGVRDAGMPERAEYDLELAKVRELAHSIEGPLPVALHALVIARREQPHGSIVAGRSWFEPVARVFPAYQIEFPDDSIVIDGAYRAPADAQAYAQLERAMQQASSILLTHTHPDHTEAISHSAHLGEIVPKLTLTRAQLDEPWGLRRFPEGSLSKVKLMEYEARLAFAPGVVLIAAPGHTAGSQMVYVQLQSGAEFLLLGDVVWDMENVRSLTGRPHVLGSLLIRGDEAAVSHQIRALHDALEVADEPLHMVPSHDAATLEKLQRASLIGEGFRLRE